MRLPFHKKQTPKSLLVIASLNARLQPVHRGEHFEDLLDEILKEQKLGAVTGGGTMQSASGEIEFCDIEITIHDSSLQWQRPILDTLERLGAPKGSKLTAEGADHETPFGSMEGMAVYLNGTDLPDEIYRTCDSNFVYLEFDRLLEGEGKVLSYWQGPTETAFYLYGRSFHAMRSRIDEFTQTFPLCQRCRIEQIA
jgi:hypothetical protein